VTDLRGLVVALFRKTACFRGQGGIVLMVEEVRTNLTATPLLTCPISGPSPYVAVCYTLTDSCDSSKETRRHSPSLILWSVFTTSLGSLAFVDLTRNSYRNIGEKWASQISIADDRYLRQGPRRRRSLKRLLAVSLTRAIESGTIVASPAVRVGIHLALPLSQLQGGNRGVSPTSLQYNRDSLWLSCGRDQRQ
jgi:hypothetical protein